MEQQPSVLWCGRTVIKEITTIVDGPISAEVVAPDADGMVAEAQELVKIHKNIVIKIPMTLEGLKATKRLTAMGIKTNVTLIFSATQALLAARAGATYVSPFVGRLDDISDSGIDLVEDMRTYSLFTTFLPRSSPHLSEDRRRDRFCQGRRAYCYHSL